MFKEVIISTDDVFSNFLVGLKYVKIVRFKNYLFPIKRGFFWRIVSQNVDRFAISNSLLYYNDNMKKVWFYNDEGQDWALSNTPIVNSIVGWSCSIQWLHLWRGVTLSQRVSWYDTKQSECEVPVQSFGECGVHLHCHCPKSTLTQNGSLW